MSLIHRSISLRLTAILGVIVLCVFGGTGFLLHRALALELEKAAHEELLGKIKVVRHFVDEARSTDDVSSLRHHLDDMLIGHRDLRVWLKSSEGTVLYGSGQPSVVEHQRGRGYLRIVREDGVPMDAIDVTLTDTSPLPVVEVRLAIDVRPREYLLANYRNVLLGVGTIAVLLTIGLSALAAWRGLAPVKRLSDEANRITPHAFSLRLSTDSVDTELYGLAHTFNGVLDRLEAAYHQMEAFNADVAHELRTPLATLINGTQLILASNAPPASDLRETLASNLEDLEQLKSLINDMLFLARADRGDRAQGLQQTDLAIEADEMIEYYEAVLGEADIRVVREGSAVAMCNGPLIRRALANLLSNAIKHTERGRTIAIQIKQNGEIVRVTVFNPGPGIAPAVAARMFDRFYRGDEARVRGAESHGLGLAIVRAIARMHGGTTFFEPRADGNSVGLEIPLAPAPVA